jgi:hypothetical protein
MQALSSKTIHRSQIPPLDDDEFAKQERKEDEAYYDICY